MNSKPSFLSLPTEIRQMILEELLVYYPRQEITTSISRGDYEEWSSPDSIELCPFDGHKSKEYQSWLNQTCPLRCRIQVLKVCRLLYQEGKAILCANNSFSIDTLFTHLQNTQRLFWKTRLEDVPCAVDWSLIQHIDLPVSKVFNEFTYIGLKVRYKDHHFPWKHSRTMEHRLSLQSWIRSLPNLRTVLTYAHESTWRKDNFPRHWWFEPPVSRKNQRRDSKVSSDLVERALADLNRDGHDILTIATLSIVGLLALGHITDDMKAFKIRREFMRYLLVCRGRMPLGHIVGWEQVDIPVMKKAFREREEKILRAQSEDFDNV